MPLLCHQANRWVSLLRKNLTGLPRSEPHWTLLWLWPHHLSTSADAPVTEWQQIPASIFQYLAVDRKLLEKIRCLLWNLCLSLNGCGCGVWVYVSAYFRSMCCKPADFWGIEAGEPLRTDDPPTGDVSTNRKWTAWTRTGCCLWLFSQWQVNIERLNGSFGQSAVSPGFRGKRINFKRRGREQCEG